MRWVLYEPMTAPLSGFMWSGILVLLDDTRQECVGHIWFQLIARDATDALLLAERMLRGLNAGVPDETALDLSASM